MEVEAAVETPLIFAGNEVTLSVTFLPPISGHESSSNGNLQDILLSGYAVVQGSFKIGDMLLSEPFADTRKQGIVLTKRGIEYGQPPSSGSLFAGVLDGLRHLVVTGPSDSSGGRGGSSDHAHADRSDGGTRGGRLDRAQSGYDHDEGDYPIFSTSQLLLFTDLKLTKPEKFVFSVDLPEELPPTYRSRSLHISYSLVVGFERIRLDANSRPIDSKPFDTRLFLPLRVLAKPLSHSHPDPLKFDLRKPINAPPPHLISSTRSTNQLSSTPRERKSSQDGKEELSMPEYIESLLNGDSQVGSRRKRSSSVANIPGAQHTKVSYDISKNKDHIAELVLAKPATHVGDVLAAQIRLKRPCLHISVYLELEEQIEEPYAALAHTPLGTNIGLTSHQKRPSLDGRRRADSGGEGGNSDQQPSDHAENGSNAAENRRSQDTEVATTYTIYARQFQGVYGLKELPIYLPTLTSITPRLDTEQITASWSLRIEFVGLTGSALAYDEENNGLLAKGQVDHETLTCRIPVVILPPAMGGHGTSKTWRY